MSVDKHPDLASMRARLDGLRGRQFWRSLEELAETPEFRRVVEREFPQAAAEWFDPVARRGFLKLMGASLALAGATACTRQPDELLVPVREDAGEHGARTAAVLRDGDAAREHGDRAAGREPRGTADEDRGESGSSREPRCHRCLRAGVRAAALRSRSLAVHHVSR